MDCIEHIEIKEKNDLLNNNAQDILSTITDSQNITVLKSFSVDQAIDALHINFFDEAACHSWILKTLHPKGAFCPHCKTELKNESAVKLGLKLSLQTENRRLF